MFRAVKQAVIDIPGGFFIALIVERVLGLLITVGADAPGESGWLLDALRTVQDNFYLLVLLGVVVAFLTRAHIEANLVNTA